MKKILALMLVLTMSISLFNLNIFCKASSGKEINVLMVGNFLFTHCDTSQDNRIYSLVKTVLPAVCNDVGAGNKNVNIKWIYGEGATMFQFDSYYDNIVNMTHYSSELQEMLGKTSTQKFDYVILNPSRRCNKLNMDNEYTTFEKDATGRLIELAQSKGSKVILCAQFGFNTDTIKKYYLEKGENDIYTQKTATAEATGDISRKNQVAYNKQFCKEIAQGYNDVSIATIGDSFEKAIDDYEMNLYDVTDNIHYNTLGAYLEACCLYDAMFNTSCSGFNTTQELISRDEEYKLQAVADYCYLGLTSIATKDIALSSYLFVYDGEDKTPEVTVAGLTIGKDFEVSYTDNKNAGTAYAVVEGKGEYCGKVSVPFSIEKASISGKNVCLSKSSYEYNGEAKAPEVTIEGLTVEKDFEVSYTDNKNAGTAYAVVEGKGNYCEEVSMLFSIEKASISSKDICLSKSSYEYDGEYKTPKVTIAGLTEGKDFEVKYKANKKIGTATVTVTGKNNFKGKKIEKFYIVPKGTKLKKLYLSQNGIAITWKAQANQTNGYSIMYATNRKFTKNCKTVVVSSNKKTSKIVKSLKSNCNYYVKVRTYKKVNGKKYYSSWSNIKKIKVI